jgi:phosphopantetheinyl transferase
VGVDVEVPKQRRDARALAEAYLSPTELRAVAEEGEPALLAFWTMREAMAKLAHDGLAGALALDGAAFAKARNASCSGTRDGQPWVLAHRETARLHVAIAWTAEHLPPHAAALLASALEAAWIGLPPGFRSGDDS